MITMLSRYWWVLALHGFSAIVFGVLALIWPALTLLTPICLFDAYAIFFGTLFVILAFGLRGMRRRAAGRPLAGT